MTVDSRVWNKESVPNALHFIFWIQLMLGMQIKLMMLHIPEILSKQQVVELRQQLDNSQAWIQGQHSAGFQAQNKKIIYRLIPTALLINPLRPKFFRYSWQHNLQLKSAALPKHILLRLYLTAIRIRGIITMSIMPCNIPAASDKLFVLTFPSPCFI